MPDAEKQIKEANTKLNREITECFAAYLRDEGWCFDFSTAQPRAYNMKTNHHAAIAHLTLLFGDWRVRQRVKVAGEYRDFIEGLNSRLQQHLTRIVGHAFRPDGTKLIEVGSGVTLANTHVPYRPDAWHGAMPPIFAEYFDRVFMNDQDREMVLDWCADIIQNPMRRPEWGVIMSGDQGTGKSTIATLVRMALGGNHVWQRNEYKPAIKEFSEVLPNHLLLCFDDATAKADTYDKLKYMVTTKQHPVEVKFVQQVHARNVYARILICTNKDRPFNFDGEDRRFYVCERSKLKGGRQDASDFFEKFYQWLGERDTAAFLYHFFMQRNLSQFKPGSTIQTRTLALMGGASAEDIRSVLRGLLSPQPCVHIGQVEEHLKKSGYSTAEPRKLVELMESMGYKKVRRKVPGCPTQQVSVWQPSGALRGRSLSDAEVDAIQRFSATGRRE